ncbi:MAG TPA: hypothetical protein VJG90_07230 [Candidatus Nanoarchaeia archaeon]|nr:hypothetical protein [Candidatus Nanoarchaeia archaeon]
MKLTECLEQEYQRRMQAVKGVRELFDIAVQRALVEHAKRESVPYYESEKLPSPSLPEVASMETLFEEIESEDVLPESLDDAVLGSQAASHYSRVGHMADYAQEDLQELARLEKNALFKLELFFKLGPEDLTTSFVRGLLGSMQELSAQRQFDKLLQSYFVRLSTLVDNLYDVVANFHGIPLVGHDHRRHQIHDTLLKTNIPLRNHLRSHFYFSDTSRKINALRNQFVHAEPDFDIFYDRDRTPLEPPRFLITIEALKHPFFDYVAGLYVDTLNRSGEAMSILLAEPRPAARRTSSI